MKPKENWRIKKNSYTFIKTTRIKSELRQKINHKTHTRKMTSPYL